MSPGYIITGSCAHSRVKPLLPDSWTDYSELVVSPGCLNSLDKSKIFLWENGPQKATRCVRDTVQVYSHLPNGSILDDKWALGRISQQNSKCDGMLETHCFRGRTGLVEFVKRIAIKQELQDALPRKYFSSTSSNNNQDPNDFNDTNNITQNNKYQVQDSDFSFYVDEKGYNQHLWVIKDAGSNGAFGVWVVDLRDSNNSNSANSCTNHHHQSSLQRLLDDKTSPLIEGHRYVAQKYVNDPFLLWKKRKIHVRAYVLLTCTGLCYIHRRAFLHVANDPFETNDDKFLADTVHITNCCANSHDEKKFSGEICIDFEDDACFLHKFFSPLKRTVKTVVKGLSPYCVSGGEKNNGFEYLGLDFMLTCRQSSGVCDISNVKEEDLGTYLLEINAPPSQDTASGLPHAEDLHNEVIGDLLRFWVLPKIINNGNNCHLTKIGTMGGWRSIFTDDANDDIENDETRQGQEERRSINYASSSDPSKAALINKMRWAIFEKQALSREAEINQEEGECNSISLLSRSSFSYYNTSTCANGKYNHTATTHHQGHHRNYYKKSPMVYFENAGGSQVPDQVVSHACGSLVRRNRSREGNVSKKMAREALRILFNAPSTSHSIFLGGNNASSCLQNLALLYAGCCSSASSNHIGSISTSRYHHIGPQDTIVIALTNHEANIKPWEMLSRITGAQIIFWDGMDEATLSKCVSQSTRIVAIPHASNILGYCYDVQEVCSKIKKLSQGKADVVVDAVASAAHVKPDVTTALAGADWVVVSLHKLYCCHIGVLCGKHGCLEGIELGMNSNGRYITNCNVIESVRDILERGTLSYEACEGIIGLMDYFSFIGVANNKKKLKSCDQSVIRKENNYSVDASEIICGGGSKVILPFDVKEQRVLHNVYDLFKTIESCLTRRLLRWLNSNISVRVIEDPQMIMRNVQEATAYGYDIINRLPIVCFVHDTISPQVIVDHCEDHGICIRCGSFLSPRLLSSLGIKNLEVVRVSIAHYNSISEIDFLIEVLELLPLWQISRRGNE